MNNFWDDEDYGYFDEPSEVDKIFNDAVNAIKDQMSQVAKDTISEAKKAHRDINTKKLEIENLDRKIAEKRKQIEDLNRIADEEEVTNIPKRILNRIVKVATKGVAPGDMVWTYETTSTHPVCKLCNGEKRVLANIPGVKEPVSVQCPKCNGYGSRVSYYYRPVLKKATYVSLKICFRKDHSFYWNTDKIYLNDSDFSTDVGHIWETKEEAQKWCDEQNAEEKEEE